MAGRRGLLCTVLLYCLTESRGHFRPLNDRGREDDSLADILRKVSRASSTSTRDVLLVLRDSSSDGQADDILGKILAATARRAPTFYVNACQAEPEFQVSSCALSRDLLVYIYVSQREPDIVEGELVADDLRRFVHTHSRPKVLVLLILRQSRSDLAILFRAIWSRRILDAIVVEYCRANEHSTTVHRYDPFAGSITQEAYHSGEDTSEWFADDFPDMRGYPFAYAFLRRPPYSDVVSTSAGGRRRMKGVDWMIIQALADKMNFSGFGKILTHNIYIQTWSNGSTDGIIPDLISGEYETLFNTMPVFVDSDVQFTDSVHVEKWCFVVPRLPARQNLIEFQVNGLRLFFASFSIVGIVWLCARFMRLEPSRWHPLRIVGIMLTSSFPPAPSRLHERIVFISIFAACARYSSSLFAELMSVTLESDRYARFDHLSDLIDSDLTLMMYRDMVDIVQDSVVLENRDTERKIRRIDRMDTCLETLLMHRNVACFMEQGWAELAAVNNMRDGESMLRTTKLCYRSSPTGYIFSKGSPYVRRVSELLLMLTQGGIREKWQRDYLHNETREMSKDKVVNRDRMNFMYVGVFSPMLCVLKIGYSLSILVFIGELIWKRLVNV
ncbi:hypothetical protein EAI_00431 [Harpegnathos saltator]|uniref:Ionotropic glutamate receptor C-terminal domain-containing protein n=1 Tax=Harpegnathos saltator TaxID=610380 RepID=E2BK81_HARSA|nr:hypothetical protein EAI_00431 [Harpegnathos saltator]